MNTILGLPRQHAPSERCSNCVLPLSVVPQAPGNDRVCKFCGSMPDRPSHPADSEPKTAQLEAMLNRVRELGRGCSYDCLIGLSGGRDSSYLAWLLRRKHGLRCFGAYYRTPFTPDVIDANVRRVSERLGIPLTEIQVSRQEHLEVARAYFLKWRADPKPEYINLMCASCKLLNREVFRLAKANGLRAIIFGGNEREQVQFTPSHRESKGGAAAHTFLAQLSRSIHIARRGFRLVADVPPGRLGISVKAAVMYINPHTPLLRLRYPGIMSVEYFRYSNWREDECIRTITEELGWQLPEGVSETWRADCDIAALKNYMFFKTVGATYSDALFSNLIRDGQLTREQALDRIKRGHGLAEAQIERAMKTLGLSMDLIDRDALARARSADGCSAAPGPGNPGDHASTPAAAPAK
ncbi:MAG: hypothetical protein H7A45_07315 [Verrucomicrobiales bacterium]|nr:hypothetical protein [Verrucomicrobiales bacterium]